MGMVALGVAYFAASYVLLLILGKLGLDRVAGDPMKSSGVSRPGVSDTPSAPATYTFLVGLALFFLGGFSFVLGSLSGWMLGFLALVIGSRIFTRGSSV